MLRKLFISGVRTGLGHALASHYLDQDVEVWAVSRRPPTGLLDRPGFHFLALDLTDESLVREKLLRFLEPISSLDLAILNAGQLGRIADLADLTLPELRSTMEINLWANKTLIDLLFQQRTVRQLVTMSSGAAVNGNRGWGGYALSKAALNMLTQLSAREHPDCHFAAVAPGLVQTAMQDQIAAVADSDKRFPSLASIQSKRGTPEMPTPAELAPRLAAWIETLPSCVSSGEFSDIRTR